MFLVTMGSTPRYDLTTEIQMGLAEDLFGHLETTGQDLDVFVSQAIEQRLKGGVA